MTGTGCLLLSLLLARLISRPIETVTAAMTALAEGRSDAATAFRSSREIDRMLTALDRFRELERERLAAENSFLLSEERFRHFAESSADCYWELDADLRFRELSESFELVTGLRADRVIGRRTEELLQADYDKSVWDPRLDSLLRHEAFRDFEIENVAGSSRWMRWSGIPIFDEAGAFAGYRGTISDISDRKQAEAEVRQLERQLFEAIEAVPVGVVMYDANRHVVLFNKVQNALFPKQADVMAPGISFEELLRTGIDRGQYEGIKGREDKWLEERLVAFDKGEGEHEIHLDDGRWILAWDYPTRDGGRIGIRMDISGRKHTEESLRAAVTRAQAASQAKSEFLSSVNHELRTPLNAIVGFAELIATNDEEPVGQSNERAIERILENGLRLTSMVDQLLDLAELDETGTTIETTSIDDIVQAALSRILHSAEKAGISLVDNVESRNLPCVDCAPEGLLRALSNLLSNAVLYNKEGGEVVVDAAETNDGYLRIFVSDTGAGISADARDETFAPFQRLGFENSSIAGVGVGLTLAKRLVEAMHGRIDFESELGQGSRFWIDLPLAESNPVHMQPQTGTGSNRC